MKEDQSDPTPEPSTAARPTSTTSSLDTELEKDSPRPAVISPIPPTWTAPASKSPSSRPSTPTSADSEQNSEPFYYIVQAGDTLGEIAVRFDVAVDDLAKANGLEDIDHIEEGQALLIP